MEEAILKIGDEVLWAGTWGREPYRKAKITAMEVNCDYNEKFGVEVESATWKEVNGSGIVTLDNGHWAYGYQIKPIDNPEQKLLT